MERVGFQRDRIGRAGCARANSRTAKLEGSAAQHCARKIRRKNGLRIARPMFEQRHGHVAGAAANVEDGCTWIGENRPESARGAAPPETVNIGR